MALFSSNGEVKKYSDLSEDAKDILRERRRDYYNKNKEAYKERYIKNKDKQKEMSRLWRERNKEKRQEYDREYFINNRDTYTLNSIRRRAKKIGVDFDLDVDDIMSPDVCPVFGFTLERGVKKLQPNSPSVDRLVPSSGYIKGNTQVISQKANMMKQDATPEELRMFAKWVLKTFPEEPDA